MEGSLRQALGCTSLPLSIGTQQARQPYDNRVQAQLVSGWIGGSSDVKTSGDEVVVTIANQSTTAVFGTAVFLVAQLRRSPGSIEELTEMGSPGDPSYRLFGVVPPGRHAITVPWRAAGMFRQPAVELAFSDAAGAHWIRRASGELQEATERSVRRFNLDETLMRAVP